MTVQLNHTIVTANDKRESAEFLAGILGLPPPEQYGPFLVGEAQFDEIFGRIQERPIPYYADPAGTREGEINTRDGGRGCYFRDPAGHWLEILTRPYGSGG